jgi:hypothetical protein
VYRRPHDRLEDSEIGFPGPQILRRRFDAAIELRRGVVAGVDVVHRRVTGIRWHAARTR